MALVCASCGTENRLAARFCIECVLPLPVDFAPTQQLPLRAPPKADALPEALAAFAAGPPSVPSTPSIPKALTGFDEPAEKSGMRPLGKVRAFMLLSAGFALAAAAGWFVAVSEEGESDARGTAGVAAAPAALAPIAAASAAPVPVAPAAEPSPTAAPPVTEASVAPSVVETSAAPASAPPATAEHAAKPEEAPRTQGARASRAPSAAPAVRDNAVAMHEPAPVHRPATAAREGAGLLASCESLGFISRSRCKVDICSRAANQRRAECRPVLEQQRLVEEKRNPQMAY